MDPQEDYPSDSDASDEDFRPDQDEGSGSELESDDNVDDQENGDEEPETKTGSSGKKRKRAGKKVSKKKAKLVQKDAVEEKQTEQKDEDLDEDDEERLTDALWADFLAGSNSSTSSSSKEPTKKSPVKTATPPIKSQKPIEKAKPETVTKIFEFAGETVEVTEPAPSGATVEPPTKPAPKPATLGALSSNGGGLPRPSLGGRSSGGGLGAVLGQIGKKNKLSVLEKTQLDWKSFKRTEGIEEELQTHNRGRDGYLERQDFLQRADLRQFEIEKNFRQSKSKR